MVIRKLQSCTSAAFKNIYFSSVLLLLIVNLNVSAVVVEQSRKPGVVGPSSSVNNIINKNINSSNKTEVVEGSADGAHGRLADVEVNGSGYPTDDEDGDDVHGSGSPPPTTTPPAKPKQVPPHNIAVTTRPTTTTMSSKPTLVKPATSTDRQKELKVDSEEDDDDEDEDDEEDDEDFADENINDDMDVFTTSTTTSKPFVAIMSTTPKSMAQPTHIPPRINQNPTTTVSSGPFSPFHETMTNGFYAAIAGGVLVAVITAILLVLFVVFRIRKKDEGSYALDEPKQTRPYATYAYTKASTKEFYA